MISINRSLTKITLAVLAAIVSLSSCNKDVEQFPSPEVPTAAAGTTLSELIRTNPRDSLYYKLILKAGLADTLNNRFKNFTVFVPDSTAVKAVISAATGGAIATTQSNTAFSAFIASALFPTANAVQIVSYNIVPQNFTTSLIPNTFPNYKLPTLFNPAPALSALLRLDIYPTTRNGAWVNNIPLVATDVLAANGVIHRTAAFAVPPSVYLATRVNNDPDLTYLKAAIQRADQDPTAPGALFGALGNIGANLTLFAPVDAALKPVLQGALYQGAIAQGATPAMALAFATANAATPAGFALLPITSVKGIVVYHILGVRAFANNFPTTVANFPTLLNGAIPSHPGIGLQVTLGATGTVSATVKGAANATASNITINPLPSGSSDQNCLNGVMHKIDQTLLPQ